jgi:hypothetical protein
MRYRHTVSFATVIKMLKKTKSCLLSIAAKLSRVQRCHRNSIIQTNGRNVPRNNLTGSAFPYTRLRSTPLNSKSTTKQIPLNKCPVTEGVTFDATHCAPFFEMSRLGPARLSLSQLQLALTNFLGGRFQAGPFVEAQSNAGFRWPHADAGQVIELADVDAVETAGYTNVPAAADVQL